jgi:MarR family transcriptional regulator, organic hydroperoxide resistance regulator
VDPLYELALSVKAIHRELERQTNAAMRPLGLTAAQADALTVIGQAEPLALNELGALLIAEGGHPSRLVDRLVAAGLVDRRDNPDDRRQVELSLTPAGHALERKIAAARQGVIDLARQLVGDRDIQPGLEVLRDLVQLTTFADLVARRRTLSEAAPGTL